MSKYAKIAEHLTEKIQRGTYNSVNPFPTEQALVVTYGVSRQTIRQALKVLVEQRLIIRRQGSGTQIVAKAVTKREIRRVAVISTYIHNYIFPDVLQGMDDVFTENRCITTLFATRNKISKEREILESLLDGDIDGLVVEGTKATSFNPNLDLYQKLREKNIPIVFFFSRYPQLKDSIAVMNDNIGGGRQLVNYLHSKGHTRIAGIFKGDDIQGQERFQGYITTLRDLGLPINDENIFWFTTETMELVISPTPSFNPLNALKDCTAVVCYCDAIAAPLCNSLVKNKIRVPEDMAIVSFDNSEYCNYTKVPITSLTHEPINVGTVAAQKLLTLMDGGQTDSVAVPWTLVERQSS